MALAFIIDEARRVQLALSLLQGAQAFMDDLFRHQAQIASGLKVDTLHRTVQVIQALLDHRDLMVDIAEQLGDAVIRGAIEVFQEALEFLRQGFLGQHTETLQIPGYIHQFSPDLGKRPGVYLQGVGHTFGKLCFLVAQFLAERFELPLKLTRMLAFQLDNIVEVICRQGREMHLRQFTLRVAQPLLGTVIGPTGSGCGLIKLSFQLNALLDPLLQLLIQRLLQVLSFIQLGLDHGKVRIGARQGVHLSTQ